jgi:uncharacterized repeat protein (TIGR01451 family)
MKRVQAGCYAKALLVAVSGVFFAAYTCAQAASLDLLLGLGDFEKCSYSSVLGLDEFGAPATSDLSVANGWTASIDLTHQDSYVYRIVTSDSFTGDGGGYLQPGKSYQYMAIKNEPGRAQAAEIFIAAQSNPKYLDDTFHVGDTLVVHIDRIVSSNFVAGKQTVFVGAFYKLVGDDQQHNTSETIDLSAGFVDNVEFTVSVPDAASINYVRPSISLHLGTDTVPGETTGILLTGAKIFLRRNGSMVQDTEAVPYAKNRSIQTNVMGWYDRVMPVRAAARTYDYLCTMASEYPRFAALRKLNPEMKIYIYQGGMDANDSARAARWCVSPFRMDYVVDKHPDWLWPQTDPPVSRDPDSGSVYAAQYANLGGLVDRYLIAKVTDQTYQNEWVNSVIALAKSVGADGVWIDNCTNLNGSDDRDGYWRYTWEVQQFLHYVIPRLRAVGLSTVVNNAQGTLDGSASWTGDVCEAYYNPTWKPTPAMPASEGYSENTPDNTPDVLFREFSIIGYNHIYSPDYWLKCINDAKIVSEWNSALPENRAKRIQYSVRQDDTDSHPAYDRGGKPGWIPYVMASFLLCCNKYVSLGISLAAPNGNYADAMVDFSITKKLGAPVGDDAPVGESQYFRMRSFASDGAGSSGGIVAVNADTSHSYDFLVPFNAIDDTGKQYQAGSRITFLPNMGRILFNSAPGVTMSVVSPEAVVPAQVVTITVNCTNTGDTDALNVLISTSVPTTMDYVVGSAEATGGSYNSATRVVTWTISKIAAAATVERAFTARVK